MPLSVLLGPFQIMAKIRGDIRKRMLPVSLTLEIIVHRCVATQKRYRHSPGDNGGAECDQGKDSALLPEGTRDFPVPGTRNRPRIGVGNNVVYSLHVQGFICGIYGQNLQGFKQTLKSRRSSS